jgi:hypothetical protein
MDSYVGLKIQRALDKRSNAMPSHGNPKKYTKFLRTKFYGWHIFDTLCVVLKAYYFSLSEYYIYSTSSSFYAPGAPSGLQHTIETAQLERSVRLSGNKRLLKEG